MEPLLDKAQERILGARYGGDTALIGRLYSGWKL
jgi:hypothetical protein